MPTQTPNLKLDTYNNTTDSQAKFQTFRASIAGDQTSNMTKIDKWAGGVDAKLISLENNKPTILVKANWISIGYYEAISEDIVDFKLDMLVTVKLNQDNDGTLTMKINELAVKSFLKYDTTGTLVNLDIGDLRKDREYQFRYDGTAFVWQGGTSADQLNIVGTTGNIVSVAEDNTIADSGVKAEQVTKNATDIGDTTTLTTTDKTSTVAAINELDGEISILSRDKLSIVKGGNANIDLNTHKSAIEISVINPLNRPPQITGDVIGILKVMEYSPDWIRQEFEEMTDITKSGRKWFRDYYSGTTWSNWKQLATGDEISILSTDKADKSEVVKKGTSSVETTLDKNEVIRTRKNTGKELSTHTIGDEHIMLQSFDQSPVGILLLQQGIGGKQIVVDNHKMYISGYDGSNPQEIATTDKVDILLTPATGYTITKQSCYKINNVLYINAKITKGGAVFATGQVLMVNLPLSIPNETSITSIGNNGGWSKNVNTIIDGDGIHVCVIDSGCTEIHITGVVVL